jgi:hypothetical protein
MDQMMPQGLPPQQPGRAMIAEGYAQVPADYNYNGGGGYPNYPTMDLGEQSSGFDFYKYLRILTKYRWLIASTIGTAIAIAAVLTFLMVPVYRAPRCRCKLTAKPSTSSKLMA